MYQQHRATFLFALIAAALLASSCDNSVGLFASIQEETKQVGSDTFKQAVVKNMTKVGTNYYAAMAKLYTRPVAGGTWTKVAIAGSTDYRLLAMAGDGSSVLYVSICDSSESTNTVYSSTDGTSWTSLRTSAISSSYVDALFYANSQCFAQVHNSGDTYTLCNCPSFTEVDATNLSGKSKPFVGVAYDGGAYWYATSSELYQGTTAITASGPVAAGKTLTSIAYSTLASALYIGTEDGYIYQYNGSWSSDSEDFDDEPITAICEIGSGDLLVGVGINEDEDTNGGYYEGTYPSFQYGDIDSVAGSESVFDTTVYGMPVNSFYYDGAESTLFVCLFASSSSTNYGLYSSVYGTEWSGWDAE